MDEHSVRVDERGVVWRPACVGMLPTEDESGLSADNEKTPAPVATGNGGQSEPGSSPAPNENANTLEDEGVTDMVSPTAHVSNTDAFPPPWGDLARLTTSIDRLSRNLDRLTTTTPPDPADATEVFEHIATVGGPDTRGTVTSQTRDEFLEVSVSVGLNPFAGTVVVLNLTSHGDPVDVIELDENSLPQMRAALNAAAAWIDTHVTTAVIP